MNAYQIGLKTGMVKDAQPWWARAGMAVGAPLLRALGYGARTVRAHPWRAAAGAGTTALTVPFAYGGFQTGRLSAEQRGALRERQEWLGTLTPAERIQAEQPLFAYPTETPTVPEAAPEVELAPEAAAAESPGAAAPFNWLSMPLGQTGFNVSPAGGLAGALGGLGLGALMGRRDEEDERPYVNPLLMATLLGGAGAFLPGLLGGIGGGASAPEGAT